MKSDKPLNRVEQLFNVSLNDVQNIVKAFHLEMKRGLSGRKSSLKMIPTYVDRPTGNENGKFIALDFGGTNFRILELELKGGRKTNPLKIMKFVLNKRLIKGTANDFFGFIAGCLKNFLEKRKVGIGEERNLGFTFSFPVKQTGTAAGTLVCWTKGFSVKGVMGKDVVGLLSEALARKGITNVKISALVNDTVGTLAAESYEDQNCDIGIILGTGTNACYVEELPNITKWHGPETRTNRMIVNIEWGNFNKLRLTSYDKRLDKASDNPGQQILEKMVSGMYLGEVARLVLIDLISKYLLFSDSGTGIFNKTGSFKTEHMSIIEDDESGDLTSIRTLLKKLNIPKSTLDERRTIKKTCEIVSLRGARVSAACLAAIITKMDPDLFRYHMVAIDGSVYEKHPSFSRNMKSCLQEIFGARSSRIKMVLAKDGSGKGAAVIAAVAASMQY